MKSVLKKSCDFICSMLNKETFIHLLAVTFHSWKEIGGKMDKFLRYIYPIYPKFGLRVLFPFTEYFVSDFQI